VDDVIKRLPSLILYITGSRVLKELKEKVKYILMIGYSKKEKKKKKQDGPRRKIEKMSL